MFKNAQETELIATEIDIQALSNNVKEIILEGLLKERFLTQKQYDEISKKYAIIVHRKNWLGRLMDFIWESEDTPKISFIKVI